MSKSQYRYCSVCRRNHNDGRGHIFSKQHKKKLNTILSKFTKKIRSARRLLQRPSITDGELEPGSTLWCYCCEEEVNRHVTDGITTVEFGGLLEHIASPAHHKKTRHFWWEHGAEKNQLQNFLLFQAELSHFKSLVSEAMDKLREERDKKIKMTAEKIRAAERHSLETASQPPILATPFDSAKPSSSQQNMITSRGTGSMWSSALMQTASNRGNVHTGAVPPWLRGDDDDDDDGQVQGEGRSDAKQTAMIGPSDAAFQKHKEILARSRKNPRRVGANFHDNLQRAGLLDMDDEKWLPSFGRVWNYGPRSHSKMEFRGAHSSSDIEISVFPAPQTPTLHLPEAQPYVRRRATKRPHPDSAS